MPQSLLAEALAVEGHPGLTAVEAAAQESFLLAGLHLLAQKAALSCVQSQCRDLSSACRKYVQALPRHNTNKAKNKIVMMYTIVITDDKVIVQC